MVTRSTLRRLALAAAFASAGSQALAGFAGSDLFLPMVGRQAGVYPSNWYTAIWVHNPGGEAATARIYFLERGTANPSPPWVDVLVAPGDTEKIDNVVESLFARQAYGALRVTCATQKLLVTSRVYSRAPGGDDTESLGQDFAAVPASFAIGVGERTQILGVHQTVPSGESEFRFNFGFVETTGHTTNVRVSAYDGNGALQGSKEFQVREFSQRQVAFKDHFPSVDTENSRLEVEVISGSGKVIAYGSAIANASQDPTTFEMAYVEPTSAASGSLTAGGVVFGGPTGDLAQDASKLFWDNASKRLGIGTTSPSQQLSLTGNLALPATTASAGQVLMGGHPFLHTACGGDCTFAGLDAGTLTGTGVANTGVGRSALGSLTSGLRNTAVGAYAMVVHASGASSTAVGFKALTASVSGGSNAAFGAYALMSLTDTHNNSAFGFEALRYNTAHGNAAFGSGAMRANTSGAGNSAFGTTSLTNNTTGSENTAVGNGVLLTNTSGDFNTGIGYSALLSNIDGARNTATGAFALNANTSGVNNTASGNQALTDNTTGSNNVAVGMYSLWKSTTGARNTAVGGNSLVNGTTGSDNTALGYHALDDLTTGGANTAIGNYAGLNLTTGNSNIYLGAGAASASESNAIRIGTAGTHTRTYVMGVRGVTTANGNAIPVMIDSAGQLGTVSSSVRFKQDVNDIGGAAAAALDLRPVSFRYRTQPDSVHFGLIAEEVANVLPELVVLGADGAPETVAYHELPALLLALLQRQQATIADLEKKLSAVEARLAGAAAH
jgi:hypothetical protein